MKITNDTKLEIQSSQFLDFKGGDYMQIWKIIADGKDTGVKQHIGGNKYNDKNKTVSYSSSDNEMFDTVKGAMRKSGHQYLKIQQERIKCK